MIEALDAHVALPAVHRALWSVNHARKANFKPRHEGFLTVEAIDHEVILEVSPKSHSVLIIRLLWNQSRVSCRRQVEENVDRLPEQNTEDQREVVIIRQRVIL